MSDRPDWKAPILERLRSLAPPDDPAAWDRATLAELRRGLGKEPHHALIRAGKVFAAVPAVEWWQDDAALVATLFGLHPAAGGRVGFGRAFRLLCDETGSESIEHRFVALLDCDREDLDGHLRHAVALLKSKDRPVDWADLLDAVLHWNHPRRTAQRTWANEFWADDRRADSDDGDETDTPQQIPAPGADHER
jgi:CRISPR system Cascade subunit CasB